MKTKSASRSAFFNPRVLIGIVLCSLGLLLALAGWSKSVTGMVRHEATAQTPGTWTATGSMNTARGGSRSVLFNNGKVLVVGGCGSSACNQSASAELYDPSTGVWTQTGSMNMPRASMTATLLANGMVLVAGGTVGGCINTTPTAELYDPDTGVWSYTASMNIAMGRGNHMAALIRSGPLAGKVLVGGGFSYGQCGGTGTNQLTSAEVYDPITGTWASTGSMQVPRYWNAEHPDVTLADGKILAVGGFVCCPYGEVSKEAETYDPLVGTWSATSPKATNASDPGFSALLSNGEVLAAGGWTGTQPNNKGVASAEVFDPATGIWTRTAEMSIDRFDSTGTALLNGQVLVAGGCDGGWGVCNLLSSAELYDPASHQWFSTGAMNTARHVHTGILLPTGEVLVAGGFDSSGNLLSSAELYTPPPVVALSNTSLTFGAQLVNTRSAGQNTTLTNTGTTTLTISSIAASADFLQKNNCGSSLPAGASCTIKVAFNPSAQGVLTGSVAITDDAANSPQTIALTGTGTVVQVTPPALDFGDQAVGTTSDPQTATITNTGSADLHISGIAIKGTHFGDFAETTTCGTKLPAGGSCAVNVIFTPTAKGDRHAVLLIVDDGGDSPQAVHLTGTGVLK